MKNNFSENCRQILGKCSVHFRFCYMINYLLTGLLVPCSEILSPRFYARTSQARSVLQNLGLSISQYGPCIRLINNKHWPKPSRGTNQFGHVFRTEVTNLVVYDFGRSIQPLNKMNGDAQNSCSTAYNQSLLTKVGKDLALCQGQSKKYMRHANPGKAEVIEVAIFGLPVQGMKMSLRGSYIVLIT